MGKISSQDVFEHWLADMDDALDRFAASVEEPLRAQLDYSPTSLDAVEAWILERYPSTESLLAPSESRWLDSLARYVGETFRRQLGGRWHLRLDEPDYAFYGLPELTGLAAPSTSECPHTLVTAAADRRRGTYLRTVLENMWRRVRERRGIFGDAR